MNKKISEIVIISSEISGIWDIPYTLPYSIIASTSPAKRRYLLYALELALCGNSSLKNKIVPPEVCEVKLSNGNKYGYYNYTKELKEPLFNNTLFTHFIVGNSYPILCLVDEYEHRLPEIELVTGLKLSRRKGVSLVNIGEKKYPLEILCNEYIQHISLQLRLYNLIKNHIPFLIVTQESLDGLTDESREIIIKIILELPEYCQALIFCDPGNTVGIPYNSIRNPKIINLDE